MTQISKSALVGYSAEQMFNLVNDVERYAEFLPWCRSSQVLSRAHDEVRASVEIAHGSLRKSFTTLNRLQSGKMIEMTLEQGPFKHLHGFWRFDVLDTAACKVSLDLEFEFASYLIGLAMGPVFNQIANSLVDAFTRRARDVYGQQ